MNKHSEYYSVNRLNNTPAEINLLPLIICMLLFLRKWTSWGGLSFFTINDQNDQWLGHPALQRRSYSFSSCSFEVFYIHKIRTPCQWKQLVKNKLCTEAYTKLIVLMT